ncbi:MAG: biotin/lipoyl-containing protein, partial [bacterium]
MKNDELFIVSVPMPFVGESIVDGVLIRWFVKAGDSITKNQILAEIETEKSTWEFESPCKGEVIEISANEGDVIEVGKPLIDIKTSDKDMAHLKKGSVTETAGIRREITIEKEQVRIKETQRLS